MSIERTFALGEICSCGKVHKSSVEHVVVKKGAIEELPEYIKNIMQKRLSLCPTSTPMRRQVKR